MLIKTPSSLLRPWSLKDSVSLVNNANNPNISQFMRDGFPYPYNLEDAERFILMTTTVHPHIFLAIDLSGSAVGGIGIHLLDDVYRNTAEIGYWLSEDFWGRGIVTDAIISLVPVTFSNLSIIRIQAGVFSNNPASMKVLEKCGFSLECIHKKAITKCEEVLDEYMYVFFRDDLC